MYKLKKVANRIYCMEFDHNYDLAMHFLRFQEYQESPIFKGQTFTLIEFMEYYAKKSRSKSFSYTRDWDGFNIPGSLIFEVVKKGIPDFNKYDQTMLDIYIQLSNIHWDDNFYLIGVSKSKDKQTLFNHEIAHAFYKINPEYREIMIELVRKLPDTVFGQITKVLEKWDYHHTAWFDEVQAYLATGLVRKLDLPKVRKVSKPFKKVYEQFCKQKESKFV